MSHAALPGSPEKKQESRDAQKVLRLLAKKLKTFGFLRTKPTFFTRPAQYGLEFVHVHKSSFEASFRIHFGFRVRSDEFRAAHLNGPTSDEISDPVLPDSRKYEFNYNMDEASWESCAQAMYQCTASEGLEWFASMTNPVFLLSPDSPLTPTERAALRREIEHPSESVASEATQRALNAV
ncbi:MAG: hypothetical protein QM750_22105 [Rubrivivax sp.]